MIDLNNWLIFGLMLFVLYSSSYVMEYLCLKNNSILKPMDEKIIKIKMKKIKTLKEQREYVQTKEIRNEYLSNFGMFVLLIGSVILFSYLIGTFKLAGEVILLYAIYPILISFSYSLMDNSNPFKAYHFIMNYIYTWFFISYVMLQLFDPLILFGVQMNFLMLIPVLLLIKYVIEKLKKVMLI